MKPHKLAFVFLAAMASLLLGACSSNNDTVADKGFNILGLVSYQPASFAPASQSASAVRTSEIVTTGLPSGDRLSFLWGAIVLEDY